MKIATNLDFQILIDSSRLVVEPSIGSAKQASSFDHLRIDRLSESIVFLKEPLKNLIWVVCKPIAPLELSLRKEPFFEFQVPVLIVEGSFERIIEYLIGFRDC